jgi:hypothetical protein
LTNLSSNEHRKKRVKGEKTPTGGHIVCPGSFLPMRPGIRLGPNFVHTIELSKKTHVHGICDDCGINFGLLQSTWDKIRIPSGFCGGETAVPGYSMSIEEVNILGPILQRAIEQAQMEWEARLWQITRTRGRTDPSNLTTRNSAQGRNRQVDTVGNGSQARPGRPGHPNNGETQ